MRLPLIIVIDEELSMILRHRLEGVRHRRHLKQALFAGSAATLGTTVRATALLRCQGQCRGIFVIGNRIAVREIALRDLIVPL